MNRIVLLLMVLALGVLACDSDSSNPTAPDELTPAATVVFSGAQTIASQHDLIRTLIDATARRSSGPLAVGMIEFTVRVDPARSIPGWGLGGYTLGPNEVEIVVDDGFGSLDMILRDRLPYIAAHEIHHAVRWRAVGPPFSLLEGLSFEGLADRFALDVIGSAPPPWLNAFPVSDRARYERLAEPELDDSFSYPEWFFGQGRSELPPWTGYTLGYLLVNDVIAARGASAASLVAEPATSFDPR